MLCVVVPVLARGVVTAIGTLRVPRPGAERRWERSDAKRQNERTFIRVSSYHPDQ